MLYSEFKKWLDRNNPLMMDPQDFLEFCALIGVMTVFKDAREI